MSTLPALRPDAPGPAAPAPQRPADPRLWKSAREFQEVFMSQFVQTMRQSAQNSELFEDCAGRETFDQMFSEAIGRQMASAHNLDLQRTLYRQLGGTFTDATPKAPVPRAAGGEVAHVR
jgi:Rod binding domain-containing protein